MKDVIKYIIKKGLPDYIEYEGISFEFQIFFVKSTEIGICYDFRYVSDESPHKKYLDAFGYWDNSFTGGSGSFLYLRQGIYNEKDLIKAIDCCYDFLKENNLLET